MPVENPDSNEDQVSWLSLPNKSQLFILGLARLAEPLANTSLQAYIYYQLLSFEPASPPSQIVTQAGIVTASFVGAQAVTSFLWGTVADSNWCGRKLVILIGLCGTGIGSLGYGFSHSWWSAALWRLFSGSVSGTVPILRTMTVEVVKDKRYQSRAFLLMPLCNNIGVILGPLLGGLLADPVGNYPGVFGQNSVLGGKDGISWMREWPYSPPSVFNAVYLFVTALVVFLYLEETHERLRNRPDLGIRLRKTLTRFISGLSRSHEYEYTSIESNEEVPLSSNPRMRHSPDNSVEEEPTTPAQTSNSNLRYIMPLRQIFSRNILLLLVSHGLLGLGLGSFNSLWFVFLSAPRSETNQVLPFNFSGGLGMPPSIVGLASAITGIVGVILQLLLYPRVSASLGHQRCYHLSLLIFPVVYLLTPYLAVVPSASEAPAAASGTLVWLALIGIASIQTLGRTFAIPSEVILINSAVPHPSRRGTIHGMAQSVSNSCRAIGPVIWLAVLGIGLKRGVVGLPYWGLAVVAIVGSVVGNKVEDEGSTRG